MPDITLVIPCFRFGEISIMDTTIVVVEANRRFAILTGSWAKEELIPVANCGDYWNGVRWLKAQDPEAAEDEANFKVRALATRQDGTAKCRIADSLAYLGWPCGEYENARRMRSCPSCEPSWSLAMGLEPVLRSE